MLIIAKSAPSIRGLDSCRKIKNGRQAGRIKENGGCSDVDGG